MKTMRQVTIGACVISLLAVSLYGQTGVAQQRSPDMASETVDIRVTIDQLSWMAWGAPVKTFEAMGCEIQAAEVRAAMAMVHSMRIGSLLTLVAGIGVTIHAFTMRVQTVADLGAAVTAYLIGVALNTTSSVISTVAQFMEWRNREWARETASRIVRQHLRGEETCLKPAASLRAMSKSIDEEVEH